MSGTGQYYGAAERHALRTAAYDRLVVPGIEPPRDPALHYSVVTALAALAQAVNRNITAVRQKPTTEAVHALRVALIKLRNGLHVFPGAWPDAKAIRLDRELHWLRSQLAGSRNWDLLLQDRALWLYADPAAAPQLRKLAGAERARALDHVAAVIRTSRCERLEDSLTRLALPRMNAAGDAKGGQAALRAMERQFEAVLARKHACGEEAGDFHRLRKAVRRLRYTGELLEGSYGRHARAYMDSVAALQRELGRINDTTVALELLRQLEDQAKQPHEALRQMRKLLKRRRRRHGGELHKAWHVFRLTRCFWRAPD